MAGPSTEIANGVGTRTALWVLAVQCLLALSWTLYVLFLPGMMVSAGIDKRWFVSVLIADQLIFATTDWFAGVYADRVALVWRRLGRIVTAVTLLSSAALLAMPWIARAGNAPLLLAIIFAWAATSSALRAPVFALLGRVRQSGRSKGPADLVSLALVGISLAGAIGPYVTMLLKTVDPRLPIGVSAVSLAVAGLWALRAEAALPPIGPTPLDASREAQQRRRTWSLAAVVLIASFGTQLVTAIVAQPLLQRFVGSDALLWAAWFWVGFAVGLIPGSRIAALDATPGQPLRGGAIALLVACAAFALCLLSDAMVVLVAGLALAGAAWGAFTTVVFTSALSLSAGRATARGAGTASGLLFSAIAAGALLRLACVAAGLTRASLLQWLPEIAWLLASGLLVVVVRRYWR